MKIDQRGLLTEEDEEDSCKITEFFVDKVKSTTHFQHMESRSKAITGLHTAKSSGAAERRKKDDGEKLMQRKEPEYCSTSSNPKAKLSLIGIRRRKSGRYSASISDPIRHKEVWLGTFDTAEEASQAYFSKKAEFEKEKLSHGNKEYRSKKNCDPRKTTHIIGVQKRKNSGKYVSAIKNPISKKRVWLGTFGTAEEASPAYQSKKLEFQKLVDAKRQCSSNKQTHSTQDEKTGHENVNCELESAGGSEIDVPSSIGGAEQRIDSHKIRIAEEGFHVYGEKSCDNCDTSCDPKVKRSLIGIQRQKSGRYAAMIADPIRHKKVRLGTFDTAEEDSYAYLSKKSEFEKLRQQGNKKNKPKRNCDQIQQPESPSVMAFLDATASESGRAKRIGSHKTATHLIGAHKSKKTGRYSSMIENPITKKKIWLGTFDTAEEASHAFQSKKLEFQKLVEAKQQQCTNKQRKSEKLVNVKQEHENENENENCELKSAEIDVPLLYSSIRGTVQSIDSYQSNKFDLQSSKKVELQSNMPTDSSAGEKQDDQEDDEDLWMGKWVQLPGDDKAVMFSIKLGLPIIDNYGYLIGEFSSLDDLSIS